MEQKVIEDQPDNNSLKVFSDLDAIIIKGVLFGDHILVYTTGGALMKSMIANADVVKIKLSANQTYIVKVGQACYKVAI